MALKPTTRALMRAFKKVKRVNPKVDTTAIASSNYDLERRRTERKNARANRRSVAYDLQDMRAKSGRKVAAEYMKSVKRFKTGMGINNY